MPTAAEIKDEINDKITNETVEEGITETEVGQILADMVDLTETKTKPADLVTKADITATVNNQTGTTYTLQASDNGKLVTFNNAASITVTVPPSLPIGFNCVLLQKGAGIITIAPGSGVAINNRYSFTKTNGQYAMASLVSAATDTFTTTGDLKA